MTTRNKITIAGTIIVLAVASIIALTIARDTSPQPGVASTTDQPAPTSPTPATPSEEPQTGTDAHGDDYPADELTAMQTNATQAIEAYVTQPLGEKPAERKLRLAPFFADGSPVVATKPPVDSVIFQTTYVTTLEVSWDVDAKPGTIGVISYLKVGVNDGFDTTTQNQTWIAELVKQNGAWLTNTITKSNLPYIEPGVSS